MQLLSNSNMEASGKVIVDAEKTAFDQTIVQN